MDCQLATVVQLRLSHNFTWDLYRSLNGVIGRIQLKQMTMTTTMITIRCCILKCYSIKNQIKWITCSAIAFVFFVSKGCTFLSTAKMIYTTYIGWWSGVLVSVLASINEVNQRWARLVPRWVTVSGFNSRWGTFISLCDQPPRSTQPGHPFVGRHNEYQPNGGDALRLGSKGRYMVHVWVAGKTVWSHCYTWAISERFRDKELIMKRYINSAVYFTSRKIGSCTNVTNRY